MDKAMEASMGMVNEVLQAHIDKSRQSVSETVDGLVTVTVDARLMVTSVELHDQGMDEKRRRALELAIVAAVNGARIKGVKLAGEALLALQSSPEWKGALDQVFPRRGAPGSTS